jgi:hypothetical protein
MREIAPGAPAKPAADLHVEGPKGAGLAAERMRIRAKRQGEPAPIWPAEKRKK